MRTNAGSRFVGWSCAVLAGLLAPAVGLAQERFTLTAAVPDDVFFCVAAQDNPERKFIEDYWAEVLDALSQAGFGADLMGLIGTVGGEQGQAEAEKYQALVTELLNAVDWGQLAGREFVFAMRMPKLVQAGGSFNAGPPDYLFLMLGTPGSGAKNYEGLVKIVETVLGKIKEGTGVELGLTKTEQAGAHVASLVLQPPGADGQGGFAISLAQREDVIVVSVGSKILDHALGLLSGGSAGQGLAASARYQQAFADLPPAEDAKFFFDMQKLLADLRAMIDPVLAALAGPQDQIMGRGNSAQATHLNAQAFEAYQKGDYAYAVKLATAAHKHDPNDTVVLFNLACFNALLGNKDKAFEWLNQAVEGGFYAPNKLRDDPDLNNLRDDPRFQEIVDKAYARAGGSPETSGASTEQQQWASLGKTVVDRLTATAGIMDYAAAVDYTEGHTTHNDSVCVLTADAKQNPFYPVFGQRPPLTDFAKYVPAEAVSYSVSSGIDLNALYTFLEQSVDMVGPKGKEVLAQWATVQEQMGFDVRQDLLAWLQGESVSFSVRMETGESGAMMIKVSDEAAAREKVVGGLEALAALVKEGAAQNPQMGMFALQVAPATHEKLAGFKKIMLPMMPMLAPVVGVADGYIVVGFSEEAAALCLATGAGEHPNITTNEQVMAETLVPQGTFTSASFSDMRQLGTNIAAGLRGVQMAAGLAMMAVPPQAQPIVQKILGMLAKLTPAAQKINFYKSSSEVATFDGQVCRTRAVVNYASPAERS